MYGKRSGDTKSYHDSRVMVRVSLIQLNLGNLEGKGKKETYKVRTGEFMVLGF